MVSFGALKEHSDTLGGLLPIFEKKLGKAKDRCDVD